MIKGYSIKREFLSFPRGIKVFEAERALDRLDALVLCFPREKNIGNKVYSRAKDIVKQLRNKPLLLTLLECEIIDEGEFAFYVAYEYPTSFKPLLRIKSEESDNSLWVMQKTTEILENLHHIRLSGHFLGEHSIFVDEENFKVRLGFFGLVDAFRAHCAGPWLADRTRPDWRDDVYHLAQCFEEKLAEIKSSFPFSTLAETDYDYPDLLRLMKKTIEFRPEYDEYLFLRFAKNIKADDANMLVAHLNLNDCYVSQWQEEFRNEKKQRQCRFQTKECEGNFINAKGDDHFFIPRFNKHTISSPKGEILRVHFEYSPHSNRGESGEYHHLTELNNEKTETVDEWRIVPEKEKEFIEDTAFNATYCHFREVEDAKVNKFAFLLNEDVSWQQVDSLREKQKRLEAVPMLARARRGNKFDAGKVYDVTKGRLVVDMESDKEIGQKEGELRIGYHDKLLVGCHELSVPFEFCWRAKPNRICFVAPDDFDAEKARGKIKEMLNGSDTVNVVVSKMSGVAGSLNDVKILPEIITVDAKENKNIPKDGNLSEDVHLETIPFKRQIEAVDKFQKGDMAEPLLSGILATPATHQPLITPSVEFYAPPDKEAEDNDSTATNASSSSSSKPETDDDSPAMAVKNLALSEFTLYNAMLNGSQKEAVKGALFQKPLFLVQGPPGTGKTTVIVEIIRQMLEMNPRTRILVCSQTNLAVDNVIERLPNKKEKGHTPVRQIRLASSMSAEKITPEARKYLFDKRLKSWIDDAINRSNQVGNKIDKDIAQKNKKKLKKLLKKWYSFLRDFKSDDCQIRGNTQGGWLPLEIAFLKSMNVVGSTCVHIAASRYREIFGDTYDCLIMDEASKATPAESLIPIALAKQIVLIGDHKQLPPFITAEREVWSEVQGERGNLEDEGIEDLRRIFGKSLFEELIEEPQLESCQVMLNIQRRMPKQIGDLISKYFYDGKLESPDYDEYHRDKKIALPFKQATGLVFINTSKKKNRYDNDKATWRQNQCNVDTVIETLRCLDGKIKEKTDVAIIAAYLGQVDLLRKTLKRECRNKKFAKLDISESIVNTVDGFQGRENTIVIYDVVRSSSGGGSVGFLDDPRRLNVALSRAKKLLIIIGDAGFLINRAKPGKDRQDKQKPILGEIAEEIAREGLMFNSLEEALE